MTDRVEQLAQRLSALESEPVTSHPRVLDEVHRGLVGELERLAGVVAGDGQSTGSAHGRS